MKLAEEFITAQVAVDEQTPANGCLLGVFPRHLRPDELQRDASHIAADTTRDPDLDGRAGALRPELAESMPWQYIPAGAGSLLLFDHYFPHYSEGNKSSAVRRTAYLLYNSAEEGDFHEEHARLMANARSRFAPALPSNEDWIRDIIDAPMSDSSSTRL